MTTSCSFRCLHFDVLPWLLATCQERDSKQSGLCHQKFYARRATNMHHLRSSLEVFEK